MKGDERCCNYTREREREKENKTKLRIKKRRKRGKYELCATDHHRTPFPLVPELAVIYQT